ncbi:hypothetical protein B0H66DRAFT_475892 [Apodospora peruviana]|uniref:Secreted protein n=1 Tax=Apodospora peruviana TaxID=516989 RepID=A0AAE0M558_9PEZI|nr:hypothetical protein B0H66DRAFT_475892 [Apodospora peruviana]
MKLTISSILLCTPLVVLAAPSQLVPVTRAAAAPKSLRVIGASVLGSGCPYGSAEVKADSSNTIFDIRLSEYVVESGPNTQAADWRKNCKLTLNLQYDEGYQFTTLSTDMRGYAIIPSGVQGHCSNTVDFTGQRGEASYDLTLQGGEGPFSLSSRADAQIWSACGGGTAIMNMNTQCWISPPEKRALIALTVRVALQWRSC